MTSNRPDLSRGINVMEFTRTHASDRAQKLNTEIQEDMRALLQKYIERAIHQCQADMFACMPNIQDVLPKAAVLHDEDEEGEDLSLPTFAVLNGRK